MSKNTQGEHPVGVLPPCYRLVRGTAALAGEEGGGVHEPDVMLQLLVALEELGSCLAGARLLVVTA